MTTDYHKERVISRILRQTKSGSTVGMFYDPVAGQFQTAIVESDKYRAWKNERIKIFISDYVHTDVNPIDPDYIEEDMEWNPRQTG